MLPIFTEIRICCTFEVIIVLQSTDPLVVSTCMVYVIAPNVCYELTKKGSKFIFRTKITFYILVELASYTVTK